MSTYSLSDTADLGAGRASASQALREFLRSSGPGIAASGAWVAFGLSCLLWEDLGDWSRTHSLGIGGFVVASVALLGTLAADYLGRAGAALRWCAVALLAVDGSPASAACARPNGPAVIATVTMSALKRPIPSRCMRCGPPFAGIRVMTSSPCGDAAERAAIASIRRRVARSCRQKNGPSRRTGRSTAGKPAVRSR